jgi:hypothetical protein
MVVRQRRRRAATIVESAVVYPVLMLFVIGLIVAALGVFRYQELASLSREGARWASVRGAKYAASTGNAPATDSDVFNQAIQPRAVILDPANLNYSVTWNPDNRQGSTVTVTLTYNWVPEAFLGGITLSSTSTMTISY